VGPWGVQPPRRRCRSHRRLRACGRRQAVDGAGGAALRRGVVAGLGARGRGRGRAGGGCEAAARGMCASGAGTEETDGERIRLARVGVVASGRGRGGHPVRADGIERQDRKSVTVHRKNHRALTVPVTVICERGGTRRVARSLYYSIDPSETI